MRSPIPDDVHRVVPTSVPSVPCATQCWPRQAAGSGVSGGTPSPVAELARESRPLLSWSALRFAGLTMSNVLLAVDKPVLLDRGLGPERLAITLAPCLPPLLAGPPDGRHAQASQCG